MPYELTRLFSTTEHKEITAEQVRAAVQTEFTNRNIDGFVRKVNKVRGPYEDTFVIYSDISTESPIDPGTVIALVAIAIIAVAGAVAIWKIADTWQPHPYQDMKEIIYNVFDGRWHDTVDDMVDYLKTVHPAEVLGKSFCPFCGTMFPSIEKMRMHKETCPDLMPIIPDPDGGIVDRPRVTGWYPGYYLKLMWQRISGRETEAEE